MRRSEQAQRFGLKPGLGPAGLWYIGTVRRALDVWSRDLMVRV